MSRTRKKASDAKKSEDATNSDGKSQYCLICQREEGVKQDSTFLMEKENQEKGSEVVRERPANLRRGRGEERVKSEREVNKERHTGVNQVDRGTENKQGETEFEGRGGPGDYARGERQDKRVLLKPTLRRAWRAPKRGVKRQDRSDRGRRR